MQKKILNIKIPITKSLGCLGKTRKQTLKFVLEIVVPMISQDPWKVHSVNSLMSWEIRLIFWSLKGNNVVTYKIVLKNNPNPTLYYFTC